MTRIGIEIHGDAEIVRDFGTKAAALGAETFGVVRKWGETLKGRIVANASGRPGPRRRTGDYTRSWSVTTYVRGGEVVAEAGTNAPQGPRLEYGFTGVDALGRHYNQPPFPHAGPALTAIAQPFEAEMLAIVKLG